MIAEAVHKLLRNASAVTDVVGDRIHYAERPVKLGLPALVVQDGADQTIPNLKDPSNASLGFVRVTALADTYLGAADLARAVRLALDGYHGNVAIDSGTVRVGFLKLDDDAPIPSDHRDGEGLIRTHGRQVDFRHLLQR